MTNWADELVKLGLMDPPTSGGSSPAVYEPPVSQTNSFIPPTWYGLLSYALTDPCEHGAMIFGPRGSGKSTAIRELARAVGASTVTLQCAANMQIDSLIGVWTSESGTLRFVEGPLAECVRNGSWLLAEEANAMHPGVWSATNTLTDSTGEGLRLPTGEVIPIHPGFRLVLLYNEGSQYVGTRDVNAALKRRLVPIYATYPEREQELEWVSAMSSAPMADVTRVVDCANMIRAANLQFDLSPDILARWIRVARAGVLTWRNAYEHVIVDMLGAPEVTQPQRRVLAEIASNTVDNWQ